MAAGIFLSRIAGLVRDRIFAHYFGITYVADAFKAALRIPNTLQNLFGEGVLSASFIPVYAKLLAQKDREEAGRVAGAVFSLLALITSVLVLVGVLATPYIIDVIAFGFKGETRRLAIQLVRILFPGVGLLVMSAWCLGILNSHGKFFLSYVSPVLWNAAFIAAMVAFRGKRYVAPGGLYRLGIGGGKRTAISGADSHGVAIGAGAAHLLPIAYGKRARGDQEFCSCVLQPRRAAAERLY